MKASILDDPNDLYDFKSGEATPEEIHQSMAKPKRTTASAKSKASPKKTPVEKHPRSPEKKDQPSPNPVQQKRRRGKQPEPVEPDQATLIKQLLEAFGWEFCFKYVILPLH